MNISRAITKIKKIGLFRSIIYIIVTVLLERLHIYINNIYYKTDIPPLPSAKGVSYTFANNITAFSNEDLVSLKEYGGDSLINSIQGRALTMEALIIHVDNKIASLLWIDKQPWLPESLNFKPYYTIKDCFTLPNHRGHGLYKYGLQTITHHKNITNDLTAIIEVSVANQPSIHGIRNAGFKPYRQYIQFFKKRYFFSYCK